MNNVALENLFLIDIETASKVKNYDLLNDDWKQLWTEKIHKALPENITAEEFYPLRAGIMAEFAKVICISFGYFRSLNDILQLRIKSFYSDEEKDILENFIKTLYHLHAINNNWCFTGHNIKEFDVPFLCRRMIVNNLTIPPFMDFQNMKPWETPVTDTLHLWRFGDYKHYTSLKLLAATLGIASPKDDIDGSMVGHIYWEEKNLERIATYCQKDVVTVANVMLRFKNMPLLSPEQIVYVN
ncbi:MAG: ribonuclease H-like domain-containing protein [Ginsengibacter sp.]